MKSYIPINCSQYDLLESFATLKTICVIQYRLADEIVMVEGIIKTLKTKNKQEFLYLENGSEIRLDAIISINGNNINGIC